MIETSEEQMEIVVELLVSALMYDCAQRKQYFLEQALKALDPASYKKFLEESGWEEGVPPKTL